MKCYCARFPEQHEAQRLCGIGFNEFLGEVQARLIKLGFNPPVWPDPKIRDQGDLDEALDVCVQWCADRLRPEESKLAEWISPEPTPEMIESVSSILQPYAAKLVWARMLKAALVPSRVPQHRTDAPQQEGK